MATTSSTTKTKPDNQSLNRSRSLGRKPKPVSSSEPETNADGSDRKTIGKPLPNYLKPTISSRPDPVKFLRKNNAVEDNQRVLRRRSYDHPRSSLTSSSTSSSLKSLNTSPARPRDRPAVPREKPVIGLRSTSFHGSSRGGLRGSSTVKASPAASRGSSVVKKSGHSGCSSSKSKKEGSENVPKKPLSEEITSEPSPLADTNENEEEIVKVETDVKVSELREELKEEDKDQVARPDESVEEKEISPVEASTEEEKGELINEDKTEEQKEQPREPETTEDKEEEKEQLSYEDKTEEQKEQPREPETSEDKEEEEKKVDDDKENSETANVEESKEEEEAGDNKEESEISKMKEEAAETKTQVEELPEEETTNEVGQGKKESPTTAYNDVIASKMQENSKKNKVLALAGAFQTVIDYETAASK